MSDEQLRALERRWEVSGDAADEARLLAARLRAGELPRARLGLAARLGHGPAIQAVGRSSLDPAAAEAQAAALDPARRRAVVRLALRLFEGVRPQLEWAAGAELGPVHGALELWCRDLGARGDAAAMLRLRRGRELLDEAASFAPFLEPPAPQVLLLIERCLELAATETDRALAQVLVALGPVLEPALEPWPPDAAWRAPAAELIAWALGPAHAPARAQDGSGAPGAAACHTE